MSGPGDREVTTAGRQTGDGRTRRSSPDSDLEAFSHNPAHGSFVPLAFQPSAMTNCANQRDTVLVSTINDADQGSADVTFRTPLAPYEKSKSLGSGGSMVARLKLKGIDGRAPPGVEPAA
ncbi:hypothetical protein LWI28_020193 [Acer negundo]|uniref:Uncharacterized protein n=1 Tax=Acer negundo TaxID=4023 RepID=A0AAD5NEF2_ACENE|nr:hypothetical protein LWI28_020193 [Acer negundo]